MPCIFRLPGRVKHRICWWNEIKVEYFKEYIVGERADGHTVELVSTFLDR